MRIEKHLAGLEPLVKAYRKNQLEQYFAFFMENTMDRGMWGTFNTFFENADKIYKISVANILFKTSLKRLTEH
jgi:hypothetical protein